MLKMHFFFDFAMFPLLSEFFKKEKSHIHDMGLPIILVKLFLCLSGDEKISQTAGEHNRG